MDYLVLKSSKGQEVGNLARMLTQFACNMRNKSRAIVTRFGRVSRFERRTRQQVRLQTNTTDTDIAKTLHSPVSNIFGFVSYINA